MQKGSISSHLTSAPLFITAALSVVMKSSDPVHEHTSFDISIFNGLRVLANFFVVFGHVFFFASLILDDPKNVFELRASEEPIMALLIVPFFALLNYTVDTFLFLSGYFFAHSFCRKLPSQQYTLHHALRHLSQRVKRLLPVYLFTWTISVIRGSEVSRTLKGLFEMFYSINLHPGFGIDPIASLGPMGVAWSLTADMQAHIFMLIVLVLAKSNRRAVWILMLATPVQMAMRLKFMMGVKQPLNVSVSMLDLTGTKEVTANFALVTGMKMGNITITDDFAARNIIMNHDHMMYFSTKLRIATVFIGFVTWYIVQQRNAVLRWIEARPVASIRASLMTGVMTVVCGVGLAALKRPPTLVDAVYEALHRVVFVLAVAMFVLAIGNPANGAKSRFVRVLKSLFSNALMDKIAPLTYSSYLLHPFLMPVATQVYPTVTKENISIWRLAISALQVYAASLVLAVPLHELEMQVWRIVLPKRRESNSSTVEGTMKNAVKVQ